MGWTSCSAQRPTGRYSRLPGRFLCPLRARWTRSQVQLSLGCSCFGRRFRQAAVSPGGHMPPNTCQCSAGDSRVGPGLRHLVCKEWTRKSPGKQEPGTGESGRALSHPCGATGQWAQRGSQEWAQGAPGAAGAVGCGGDASAGLRCRLGPPCPHSWRPCCGGPPSSVHLLSPGLCPAHSLATCPGVVCCPALLSAIWVSQGTAGQGSLSARAWARRQVPGD